jgi:hypothetical protein
MLLDKLLQLSDGQALTATTVSTNTLDLGAAAVKRDVGAGEPLSLVVNVEVGAGGTTPTANVEAIQSANADLSAPDVLASSGVQAAAALFVGRQIEVRIPEGAITKQYLGARYTMGGSSPTLTVSAQVQPTSMVSQPKPKDYAKGFGI